MRYKITIEYNGLNFCGWQRQKEKLSIQELIENILLKLFKKKVLLVVAGRTDAGVHALGQVAHFDAETRLEPKQIMSAINFYLKSYLVAVVKIEEVDENFHARFSALKRHYEYRISNKTVPIVLERDLYWQIFQKLDVEKIKQNAKFFIGRHDFSSFRSSACQAKDPIRTIDNFSINCSGEKIFINVSARSFLHNQVRVMVGTLVEIGKGKDLVMKDIIAKKDRRYAGPTAPAHGLCLMKADY